MIKESEAHEARSHFTLMKKSKINNKQKNKDRNIKTILSTWYFKHNKFPDERLKKHKTRLFAHVVMQQWGVNSLSSGKTFKSENTIRYRKYT